MAFVHEASASGSSAVANLEFPATLRGRKVLLATESLGPVNGVSRTTSNLLEYLRAHDVEVVVVAPQQGHLPSATTAVKGNPKELEIRLKGYPLPYDPTLSVVFPFRIDRIFLRTFQPDVIYLASPASLGFQMLFELRQLHQQPPVLLNFQTDLSAYCEILFPRPLDDWAVWVFRSVQGYLFRHAAVKTVFYPSSYVARYLQRAGVQERKMCVLRRGVNLRQFNPALRDPAYREKLAPEREVVLICVARLAPEKGFEFLAQVATRLAERRFPFKLVVVGGNRSEDVANQIKGNFATPLLAGKVVFTGQLLSEALGRAYASADIFLHSSVTETFGLVVLEAMASGVPVIARDEGGPSDIVVHGDSGFLVPPADLDQFVARVEELGGDADLRARMSRTGVELAALATWEKINNQVAWKLADALTEADAARADAEGAVTDSTPLTGRKAHRSWLSQAAETARVLGTIVVISGVWVGLVVTWGLAQVVLFFKRFF